MQHLLELLGYSLKLEAVSIERMDSLIELWLAYVVPLVWCPVFTIHSLTHSHSFLFIHSFSFLHPILHIFFYNIFSLHINFHSFFGNCEEELPEKPIGQQVTDRLPTGYWQLSDRLPTVSQRRKFVVETLSFSGSSSSQLSILFIDSLFHSYSIQFVLLLHDKCTLLFCNNNYNNYHNLFLIW